MNVPLWELVRYPNSVKAYLADGTLKKEANFNDTLLDLIKWATQNGCPESLAIILDHPIKKTMIYEREINESLLLAAERGFQDCVEILVDHGANLNMSSSKDAFEVAIWEGQVPTARYLWQKFHSVVRNYETRDTPMHIAAKRGQHEILRRMIDDGAEVDPRGYKKATPLDMAIESPNSGVSRVDALKTIELLLEAGANINACVDTRTVYEATKQLSGDYGKGVQSLIDSKSKYKAKRGIPDFGHPIDDHSDFFNAAYEGDIERFKKYLRLYEVGICSHNGETALHFAVKNSQHDMAEFLLAQGINPSQKGNTLASEKTALEIAKAKNDTRMVNIFVSHSNREKLLEAKSQAGILFFDEKSNKSEGSSQSNDQDNQSEGTLESPKNV